MGGVEMSVLNCLLALFGGLTVAVSIVGIGLLIAFSVESLIKREFEMKDLVIALAGIGVFLFLIAIGLKSLIAAGAFPISMRG